MFLFDYFVSKQGDNFPDIYFMLIIRFLEFEIDEKKNCLFRE